MFESSARPPVPGKEGMMFTVRDRVTAATGAAFVILIIVGNTLNTAGTSQSAHPTGAQVLRDVNHQADSTAAIVGMVLEVLGFVAFMVFLGYLAQSLLRSDSVRASGAAAGTAIVAGVVMLAIKLGSAAPFLLLFLDRDGLSPQLAQLLNDLNGAAFVVSWLPFAVFVAAAAAALRGAGLVGRPTAYVGVALGAAGVVLTLVGIKDLVNANPMAFMLGVLWLLVVSIRLAVRRDVGTPESSDTDDIPAARRVPVGA
jgi:hypothetical protein